MSGNAQNHAWPESVAELAKEGLAEGRKGQAGRQRGGANM